MQEDFKFYLFLLSVLALLILFIFRAKSFLINVQFNFAEQTPNTTTQWQEKAPKPC